MKKTGMILFFILSILTLSVSAQEPPTLKVAATQFAPPYSMPAGANQFFGFDIDMMRFVCETIKRNCQFVSMEFKNIIPSLQKNEVDLAVGAIAITLKRSGEVNFSKPYLPSYAQFLTTSKVLKKYDSSLNLQKLRVGAIEGSAFKDVLIRLGARAKNIKTFFRYGDAIEALSEEDVDLLLVDLPTANYWILRVSEFQLYSKPIPYGFGLGIAISPQNAELVPLINKALEQYLNSSAFKASYSTYFGKNL